MADEKRVIVIGAGIAGLAASIRMASRGYKVTVFEATNQVGGKLSSFKLRDFRFDAGPSLFTMPKYVDDLFHLAKRDPRQYFNYKKLDTICKYWWADGTQLTASANEEKTIKEIVDKLGENAADVAKHFEASRVKYELTGKTFLEYSLHKVKTWLTFDVIKALLQIFKLDVFSSMHSVNEKRFSNPKTVQLFDRYATYNGSNPYKAPGLLNIIPHFEYGFGAFIPEKGMVDISQSVYKLACDLGVKFVFENKVSQIVKNKQKVTGVKDMFGTYFHADKVITNMDAYFTYKYLLNEETVAKEILKQERSSSALIFYWGIKQSFPQLDLHNIFFADNYKAEFEAIDKGVIHFDPTIYINITSKYVEGDAPRGSENWFVMINVPHNKTQNWDEMIVDAKTNIINKMNKALNINLNDLIVCEEVLDPRSIESKTLSYTGSLYGTSSNTKFAAFARHPNQSPKYDNLFFIGGSVHPGGGVPLALLSAKIVDDLIHG